MRLIDADKFGQTIDKIRPSKDETWYSFYQKVLNCINKAPTVEPKQGEWIEHRQFNPIGCFYSEYECSNCHDEVWQKTEWQFCPNCGADMRGKNDE